MEHDREPRSRLDTNIVSLSLTKEKRQYPGEKIVFSTHGAEIARHLYAEKGVYM